MRIVAVLLLSTLSLSAWAQRKIPNFTFEHNSTEYANANRSLDEKGQYADTLHDERVVKGLVKILEDNPTIEIRLSGHSTFNETDEIAQQRAERVQDDLIKSGIHATRIHIESAGSTKPIISKDAILRLNSAIEKEAANQRNRRVEVAVSSDKHESR